MNAYEKIIKRMRSEGGKNTVYPLKLGEVLSGKKISLGNIKLDSSLYVLLDSVGNISKGDTVLIAALSDEEYVVLGKVK